MSKFNLFARPLVFWNRKEFYQWPLTKEWVISNIIRSGSIYRLTGSFCLVASLCLLRHTLQLHHCFTVLLLLLSKGFECFVVSFSENQNRTIIRKQKYKIYCKGHSQFFVDVFDPIVDIFSRLFQLNLHQRWSNQFECLCAVFHQIKFLRAKLLLILLS